MFYNQLYGRNPEAFVDFHAVNIPNVQFQTAIMMSLKMLGSYVLA